MKSSHSEPLEARNGRGTTFLCQKSVRICLGLGPDLSHSGPEGHLLIKYDEKNGYRNWEAGIS